MLARPAGGWSATPPARYGRPPVKTRNLVVLALLCGLAILLAGGFQLLRLTAVQDDEVEVLALGTPVELDGVVATVREATVADGVTDVLVQLEARDASLLDAAVGWALLAGGTLLDPVEPIGDAAAPCTALEVPQGTTAQCLLAFEGVGRGGTVSYSRSDEQRQWSLPD
jgi:hypothetical protein